MLEVLMLPGANLQCDTVVQVVLVGCWVLVIHRGPPLAIEL